MAKKRSYKVALIIPDPHLPFIEAPLWNLVCDFCKELKPDLRVWNGDLHDFYQISRFDKSPERKATMATERDEAQWHISDMVRSYRRADDIGLPGNHEARMLRFMWKHSDIVANLGIKDMTWYSFLGLEEMGFKVLDFDRAAYPILELGHLKVYHGDRTNKHAVTNIANDWGCSVLYGHTHRMRSFFKTTYDTTHGVWESGYLASDNFSKEYMSGVADWQQGFSVVNYDEASGWFHVDQVPICKVPGKNLKRFMYRGDIYECKG